MSSVLLCFLREWLDWAEAGGKFPKYNTDAGMYDDFHPGMGLCANWIEWLERNGWDYDVYGRELEAAFQNDGLCRTYPFGGEAYDNASANDTMHKDEKRLAWVRSKLEIHHA